MQHSTTLKIEYSVGATSQSKVVAVVVFNGRLSAHLQCKIRQERRELARERRGAYCNGCFSSSHRRRRASATTLSPGMVRPRCTHGPGYGQFDELGML